MTSKFRRDCTASQQDFQILVAYLTDADARRHTAYTVELILFRGLLALGAALLRLFFVTHAAEPYGLCSPQTVCC